MNAMPQLNEAESKFFASGGQDLAPSLSERRMEEGRAKEGAAETDWMPASADMTKPEEPGEKAEKPREGKFVPLQALQEERAEKKQLREELRQFREWQAQLAQRLQQLPATPAQEPLPDPQTRPLDYINHVLNGMQASTAELQQWRQQQEQAAQQRSAVQQYAAWAAAQEQAFIQSEPDYPDAYRYAAEARDKELQALGYTDPSARAGIVRMNTAEIIHNAMQQGRNPAELVWEYARARGFAPKAARGAGNTEAQAKIAAGLQAGGAKLNQGGATGEGELSAKDLAGISDPDEFEKAWKRIFGKRK
ncbi:MAG: hypothetical protein ACM3ZT_04790 [Bacillota bacterium]